MTFDHSHVLLCCYCIIVALTFVLPWYHYSTVLHRQLLFVLLKSSISFLFCCNNFWILSPFHHLSFCQQHHIFTIFPCTCLSTQSFLVLFPGSSPCHSIILTMCSPSFFISTLNRKSVFFGWTSPDNITKCRTNVYTSFTTLLIFLNLYISYILLN